MTEPDSENEPSRGEPAEAAPPADAPADAPAEVSAPPPPADRGAARIAVVAAFLAALALYAPTFLGGHGFTNYDDPLLLSADNPAIGKGLGGFAGLLSPLRSPQFMNAWLPLYYGSLGIDHHLGGGAPWVFHLHSAILHAAGAAMVVLIARRLGFGALAAGISGVVFAVHPAATENVAWVAGRKDVLAFLWMSFAVLAWFEAHARRRPVLHLLGAACLGVSMLAKGTTLVLPALLAVHAVLVRRDGAPLRDRLRPVTPYAVVAAALTAVHLWIAGREGTAGSGTGASTGDLLVANLEVAWRYAVLLVLPVKQSVEWGITASSVDGARAVLGAAVLVAALVTVAWNRRTRPGVAAVLLCVVLALAPFNNLLPRTSVLFAERYAHVALLPVALAAGALVAQAGAQGALGAVTLAIGLGFLSFRRIPVWKDAVPLWEDAARTAPASALVRMQLADAYAGAARADAADSDAWNAKAESAWRESMSLAPDELSRMRAETGLGTHLLTTAPGGTNTEARVRECVALLDAAEARLAKIDAPGARTTQLSTIRANRGAAHQQLGETEKALADWQGAAQADEKSVAAWTVLARLYLETGRGKEAAEALARSAALAPDDPSASRDRARLRLAAGDVAGAKAELEAALARRPGEYDVLIDLARLDASIQRPVDAEKRFRRALEARPGDEIARMGIAAALLEQAQAQCARDELESARRAAESAREFAPESAAPEQVLGIVARRAGDLEEATARLRRARQLHPEGVRTREALASVLLERAVAAADAGDEAAAMLLAEEAAQADAPAVATRWIRLTSGTGGWPPAVPGAADRERVTREAALRGLALLAAGRPAEAAVELNVAEKGSAGGDPALRRNVLRLLVRAKFLTGRADEAVEAAEMLAAEGAADAAEPWRGRADLAAALAERAMSRRGAGDAAGARSDFGRSRTALEAAAEAGMPAARVHLRRGETLFAEERFVDATREFDLASEADPSDPDPYLDRAAVFRSHFLLDEDKSFLTGAERDLRRALALAPSDPRALAGLGEVLVLSARPSEAFPWLQRALLADPSQAGARRMLAELVIRAGRTHLEKKELKEARDAAERAIGLAAPTPGAAILRGDVWRAEGDWKRALEQYQSAAAAYPGDPEPQAALARWYHDAGLGFLLQGRRRDAVAALRKSTTFVQDKVDVSSVPERLHGIAVSAFEDAIRAREANDLAAAAEAFALSVQAEPTKEGWHNLGLVRAETGDDAGAVEAFASALAIDAADVPARLHLANAHLRLGRWEEAAAGYRLLVARLPEAHATRQFAEQQLAWIDAQPKSPPDGPR